MNWLRRLLHPMQRRIEARMRTNVDLAIIEAGTIIMAAMVVAMERYQPDMERRMQELWLRNGG